MGTQDLCMYKQEYTTHHSVRVAGNINGAKKKKQTQRKKKECNIMSPARAVIFRMEFSCLWYIFYNRTRKKKTNPQRHHTYLTLHSIYKYIYLRLSWAKRTRSLLRYRRVCLILYESRKEKHTHKHILRIIYSCYVLFW